MEGRQLFMILAPNPRMLQRQRDQAKAKAEATRIQAAGGVRPAPEAAPAPPAAEPQGPTGGTAPPAP
jgi:translation initiation factor IF-3